MLRIALTMILLVNAGDSIARSEYEIAEPPNPGDTYASAHYRLWLPRRADKVSGVIVLQHGCGEPAGINALDHARDPQWQAFARKWHKGLLATRLSAAGSSCGSWARPEGGTAAALERALRDLAAVSRHPEVSTVKLSLWGHSGGGNWVVSFAAAHPLRVEAVVAKSGACAPLKGDIVDLGPCATSFGQPGRSIPILFIHGDKEGHGDFLQYFIARIEALYAAGRRQDARWFLAVDATSGHEVANARDLSIRFFQMVFTQNSDRRESNASRSLKSAITGARTLAFARDIAAFEVTGRVPDDTPPPPPVSVHVRPIEGGVVVRWQAGADPESGLSAFRLYFGNTMVAERRGWDHDDQSKPESYLTWDYFDHPRLPLPPMEIAFLTSARFLPSKYTVSAVNGSGAESLRSVPGHRDNR